jgi:hypothetical protein
LRWCLHDAFLSMKWRVCFMFLCCLFRKTGFFHGILSVPNLGMGYSETHGILRKEHFFCGITKTFPSLFRWFFSVMNFDGNPSSNPVTLNRVKFEGRHADIAAFCIKYRKIGPIICNKIKEYACFLYLFVQNWRRLTVLNVCSGNLILSSSLAFLWREFVNHR